MTVFRNRWKRRPFVLGGAFFLAAFSIAISAFFLRIAAKAENEDAAVKTAATGTSVDRVLLVMANGRR